MDSIDKQLIGLLTKNARMPLKQLSEMVHLSPPAVASRIERLEKLKIISRYTAVLDPSKLGYSIIAFVNLAMPPQKKGEFAEFVKNCSNVLECYHVAGAYSMIMKVCFPTTVELDTFVTLLQNFGKTQTQIVFSAVVSQREAECHTNE